MRTFTRRSAIGAASAVAAAARVPALARGGTRPNILLILADDWSWQGAEAVDRIHLHMPNVARIRREGVDFTNAFVASPTCTASRGAILTGQWPWRLEEGANLASILPAHFDVYPDLLERAGYRVGYCRKGWAPGQIAPAGRARNPAGASYADFGSFLAQREAGAPFCFWFGTNDPHRPYVTGAGLAAGIDPATIAVPPYLPDTPAVRGDIADYRFELERLDRELGELLARLEALGELDDTIVVVTGDNGWPFPRGKATLYDAGWHVPLTLMWRARATRGARSDALVSLIDLAATFLDAAGLRAPAQMNARSLLPLLARPDRPHRAYVLGGRERHMDGRDEPGTGYPSRALRTRDHLYIRNFAPERWPAGSPPRRPATAAMLESNVFAGFADIDEGPSKAALVTDQSTPDHARDLALATAKRPAAELYDVRADPYDLVNLAAEPRHRAVAARLEATLMAALRRTGDPRVTGDGGIFDRYPSYSDPGYGRPADF